MSSLFEKIQNDVTEAQKAGDAVRVSTLRLLVSACKDRMIELRPSGKELDDAEVISVVSRQIKQRRESIAEYEKGGRGDLASKEQAELEILQAYMPAQMSEEEVVKLVDEAIAQSGAKTPAEMGKVMAILSPKIKGKADGSMVSNLVKQKLLPH